MRKVVFGLLCLGVLCMAGRVLAGEGAADLDALKKQAQELREQDRALRSKLEEIRGKIAASPDVAKLREAEAAAEKAYDEARKGDAAYNAALAAVREAQDAYSKLIDEKLAAHPETKAALKELDDLADRRAAFEFEEALARLELDHYSSPINVALGKDPELAKLRSAVYQGADKAARDAARKAYDDARKAKLDAMPEARKVMERIEAARKGRDGLRSAEAEAQKRRSQVRRTVEGGDDAEIKAAREKVIAAGRAVAEASNSEGLKAPRNARDDARQALFDKVKELLEANADAAALLKQREELRTKMGELDKKLRGAAKQ